MSTYSARYRKKGQEVGEVRKKETRRATEVSRDACLTYKQDPLQAVRYNWLFSSLGRLLLPVLDVDLQAKWATLDCVSRVGLCSAWNAHFEDSLYEEWKATDPFSLNEDDWGNLAYMSLYLPQARDRERFQQLLLFAKKQRRTQVITRAWLLLTVIAGVVYTLYQGVLHGLERFLGHPVTPLSQILIRNLWWVFDRLLNLGRQYWNWF